MAPAGNQCPQCGTSNPPGSLACSRCATPFPADPGATVWTPTPQPASDTGDQRTIASIPDPGGQRTIASDPGWENPGDQRTMASPTQWAMPVSGWDSEAPAGPLAPGVVLGGRYVILRLLGEGGMGAVYQAQDRELDRLVALKVIRPRLASNPEILARFKQELILARQVTHRNIIRIFDLGMAGSLRFITMEFVEGQDLKTLIRIRQKFKPEDAADIMLQVSEGLDVAHRENVIHRDLKPQNIMLDANGRAVVMDFGLALAAGGDEAGGSGTLVGTPDYMSPEQARGGEIDARSDVYALGIILYELVTGKLPFDAPDMMVAMRRRLEETPKPPIELDPSIPKHLNEIVMRCLAPAPDERFATAAELLHELQVFRGIAPTGIPRRWKWISASLAAMVVAAGGFVTWDVLNRPPPVKKTVTLLVADFQNNTGDPLFDNTLEPVFNVALEGASFINAYNRGQARSLAGKVKPGATRLEDGVAMLVAVREGLNVVVTGAIARDGSSYRCSARALDAITGKVIVEEDTKVAAKDQVLAAMPRLAAPIRKALGDPTSESDQRLALETLTATSLEAVHEYASGLDALSAGKFRDAIGLLSKAVERDPDFGMAYTVMASASRNLGQQQEAEKYINEALKHMGRMTERERFRTRAYLYLLTGNHQKCVDEYGALLDKYPSDTGAYTNIGVCYVQLHNIPKAVEAARKAVAILPKRAIYHGNLAMSLAYAGDAEGAAKAAEEALKLGYRNAYLHQAYVGLLRERPDQAAEAYGKFQANNASDAATGLADLAVYEGRFSDAVKMLEKGATEDMAGPKPDRDAAATKYWMLANVQLVRGQKSPALAAARRALELSKSFQARLIAARVYVAFGESAKAKELAAGLASQLQIEPQAYARLIEGEIALQAKDAREAIQIFTDANKLLDTWIGRLDLGKAYLEVGAFPEADSEFDRCIRRRGEALSLFNDLPTYGFFPPAYYYQGRAREGMKIPDFAESYKKYAGIREKATEDPLLVEVRRRIPR